MILGAAHDEVGDVFNDKIVLIINILVIVNFTLKSTIIEYFCQKVEKIS